MQRAFLYLLAPLVIVVLALGIACGDDDDEDEGGVASPGGDELTLEEYFTQVEGISTQFDEDRKDLEDKYPDAFDRPDQTRSLFEEAAPLLTKLADDLDAIDPPERAAEVHERTVKAAQDSAQFLEDTAVVLEDVQTEEELDEAVENSTSLTQTLTRLQTACQDGQELADEEDIDVDLHCPEDEGNPSPS